MNLWSIIITFYGLITCICRQFFIIFEGYITCICGQYSLHLWAILHAFVVNYYICNDTKGK